MQNKMPRSKHMGRDTAVCLNRAEDTASGHRRVLRPCEVCT
ncbi:DIS3-like exonuclease 1 [Gossypium arboreum]|uniref:DIS3-like exonuclease 1 n=1 Tax=Gossypium arboreum TaxID=29729 RepID=A0A0B0Q1L0_GOSAR|nr:DIS3-like exonuclease 1 [Gossypium arboreum]